MDWDDWRYFLTAARTGGAANAAEVLGVNQSTVSRRIGSLEETLGMRLFRRSSRGLTLREEGEALVPLAEEMERAALAMRGMADRRRDRVEGVVRLTTVEELASMVIVPFLAAFRQREPGIQLELLTDYRALDLAAGEADIALRLGRPTDEALYARKLGEFGFGVYAAESYLAGMSAAQLRDLRGLDWVVEHEGSPNMPDSRWLAKNLPDLEPVLRCNRLETIIAAVLAGLGVALLPKAMARGRPGLARLPVDTSEVRGELWLAIPEALREQARIQAVTAFVVESVYRVWP